MSKGEDMQRPNLFGKSIALNGDKTSTGATCIATIQQVTCYGHSVLRAGDPTTTCPQCGKPGIIITGEDRINNHGKIQAVHNKGKCNNYFGIISPQQQNQWNNDNQSHE
ncbi:PAAR domain-containing protein [Proteus mirabilis]|uniref:PAAR domain-containing protein n=2 Tax=Proteus mirabilis TaxID=584 RepID=UPI0029BFEF35|nr:PAAR domain-containing protein [Proteus mirabilis]MDX4950244.1 PAAR domain-containing protein [Proteus mirabilis]